MFTNTAISLVAPNTTENYAKFCQMIIDWHLARLNNILIGFTKEVPVSSGGYTYHTYRSIYDVNYCITLVYVDIVGRNWSDTWEAFRVSIGNGNMPSCPAGPYHSDYFRYIYWCNTYMCYSNGVYKVVVTESADSDSWICYSSSGIGCFTNGDNTTFLSITNGSMYLTSSNGCTTNKQVNVSSSSLYTVLIPEVICGIQMKNVFAIASSPTTTYGKVFAINNRKFTYVSPYAIEIT